MRFDIEGNYNPITKPAGKLKHPGIEPGCIKLGGGEKLSSIVEEA